MGMLGLGSLPVHRFEVRRDKEPVAAPATLDLAGNARLRIECRFIGQRNVLIRQDRAAEPAGKEKFALVVAQPFLFQAHIGIDRPPRLLAG